MSKNTIQLFSVHESLEIYLKTKFRVFERKQTPATFKVLKNGEVLLLDKSGYRFQTEEELAGLLKLEIQRSKTAGTDDFKQKGVRYVTFNDWSFQFSFKGKKC